MSLLEMLNLGIARSLCYSARHLAKCSTLQPLVMLPFLGIERQGLLAKVIQQGHTHKHAQNVTLTHGDQEVRKIHVSRLPDPLSLPLRQLSSQSSLVQGSGSKEQRSN